MDAIETIRMQLRKGLVIPACPLALDAGGTLDIRHQRALFRYYLDAGAGGLAVGVHTTQFAIRDPKIGLFRPVLELAAEQLRTWPRKTILNDESPTQSPESQARSQLRIGIAGICGKTEQAVGEASLIRELGFHAGLLSLGALQADTADELIAHCRTVSEIIPLIGFYLQPAAGGRVLDYSFWRRLAEIEKVVAIKIAPFNRYQTIDVVRALAEAGREDVALYTGNDDNILLDLVSPFRFRVGAKLVTRRIVGGLLGHWAVWTRRAVELHAECAQLAAAETSVPAELLQRANEVTDCNAAFFDAAHGYAGCIPGLHEVLRRQGLLASIRCLDPHEKLSAGQMEEIDRVLHSYPHLNDDEFVARHRDKWLA